MDDRMTRLKRSRAHCRGAGAADGLPGAIDDRAVGGRIEVGRHAVGTPITSG